MLAREPGVPADQPSSIRRIERSGGADAPTQRMGSKIDVAAASLGEIGGFIEAGDVKPPRHRRHDRRAAGGLPWSAAAIEQEIESAACNWRDVHTGGEAPDDSFVGVLSR